MDVTIDDEINQALYARAVARGALLLKFRGELRKACRLYDGDGLVIGAAQ